MNTAPRNSRNCPTTNRKTSDRTRFCALLILVSSAVLISGCGSNGNGGGATVYSVGGTVSGLAGTGLMLQNNGTNNTPVTANGAFALNSPIAKNSSYDVTVLTQPSNPVQVCTVTNGSGIATSNITNIAVVCTTTAYTIGGTVTGLTGSGLVLQNNGGNNLSISGNGQFTFTQPVDLNNTYNVTVLTQPSNPTQVCVVSNASGTATADVTNVQVSCSSTIGGTVTGLSGKGLVLQLNGANNLPVNSNGAFTFTAQIAYGGTYLVTVFTQPSGPAQACIVLNGSGTAIADVTNIQLICNNNWTWIGGPSTSNQSGIYGTMGVPSPANNPGARISAATWTDLAGNFWLYGGTGYDSKGANNSLGDMWEYSNGEWTWILGSNSIQPNAVWGTLGVAAPTNYPGSRVGASTWTDASGNFWLFGGSGVYAISGCNNCVAQFNDLWEYSAGEWTWIAGPNTPDGAGTYGTKGVAAPGNVPPSREDATTWIDAAGNLWLFGGDSGYGSGSTGNPTGSFNDLWKFSAGEWTWVGGSNTVNQGGTYGTLGTPASQNIPGARNGEFLWIDSSKTVWLFGGFGYDSTDALGSLNDLWKYSSGEWTWMGGANTVEHVGVYGALGQPASGNMPGSRTGGVSWIDASGDFWLFGGLGQGATVSFDESLGDVWKYSAGEWTWMGGSNAPFQPAVYETVGLPGDPGGRDSAASWIDKSGNVWLFGGQNQGTSGYPGYWLSDLWKYVP